MIIKNVPYVNDKEEKYASCQGPPTLMMVLKFFKPALNISFPELYKRLKYKKGTWFFEAYIVELLFSLGISCRYYSNEQIKKISNNRKAFRMISGLEFNKENKELLDTDHYDVSVDFVLSKKLFEKREISIDFIIEQIRKGKLVIATVNRDKLTGQESYKGHFILIKGFDKNTFICNDAYLGERIKIQFSTFKDAFYYPSDYTKRTSKEKSFHIIVVG